MKQSQKKEKALSDMSIQTFKSVFLVIDASTKKIVLHHCTLKGNKRKTMFQSDKQATRVAEEMSENKGGNYIVYELKNTDIEL